MAIDLRGRVPRVASSISPRIVVAGASVAVIAAVFIFAGFYRRVQAQAALKDSQNKSMAATPAESSRKLLESAAYMAEMASMTAPSAQGKIPAPTHDPLGAPRADTGAVMTEFRPSMPFTPSARSDAEMEADRAHAKYLEALAAPTEPNQDITQLRGQLAAALEPSRVAPAGGRPSDAQNQQALSNASASMAGFEQGQGSPNTDSDYLRSTRQAPRSRFELQRGEGIPAILNQAINSEAPGNITATVFRDVLDSPTHTVVLIPAGSRLNGEYGSSLTYGQGRLQVAWTSVYFPDGSFIDLSRMPGEDADGSSGLKDKVDNHLKRLIGGVALSSVFAAGIQISQNRANGSVLQYPSTGQVAASSAGQQAAEVGQQITTRNLNVPPTVKIRPGKIIAVDVTRDIVFSSAYAPISAR